MLLIVSFLLRLLVGFVGLRVHTPHTLSPLPVDDAVLLFTGQIRGGIRGGEKKRREGKRQGGKRGRRGQRDEMSKWTRTMTESTRGV